MWRGRDSGIDRRTSGFGFNELNGIEKLPVYKDGSHMMEFWQSLEIEFVQSEVDTGAHKRLLVSKLTPKLKSYYSHLITDATVPYTTLKETLLADTGLTNFEVKNKLFVTWERDTKNMSQVEKCREVKDLVDRFILLSARTPEDLHHRLYVALFRIGLASTEQDTMDNQSLDCYQDLTKLAANLQGRVALGSVRHDKHVREEGRKMLPCCFYL